MGVYFGGVHEVYYAKFGARLCGRMKSGQIVEALNCGLPGCNGLRKDRLAADPFRPPADVLFGFEIANCDPFLGFFDFSICLLC